MTEVVDSVKDHYHEFPIKRIMDNVHGSIQLSPLACQFINTPTFQRLRNLRQLGVTHYVYPGATHTRFEHSIGTYHLARKWMDILRHNHCAKDDLVMTYRDKEIVGIAGLLHDIGHGPFSHVFENLFIKEIFDPSDARYKLKHEDASVMMFDYMLQEDVDGDCLAQKLLPDDAEFIRALIRGDPSLMAPGDPRAQSRLWMFDIVANQRNSVDVDKFDYLARDSYNTFIDSGFRSGIRLMELSRVIDNQICFKMDEANSIYELFHARLRMHRQVYTHRAARALEHMVVDAMILSNKVLHTSDAINIPELYLMLDDTILNRIAWSDAKTVEIKKAQKIIENIHRRHIYKMADQINSTALEIPTYGNNASDAEKEEFNRIRTAFKQLSAKDIMRFKPVDAQFLEEDIILDGVHIDYAMKSNDPVSNIRFFNRWSDRTSFQRDRDDVSRLLPQEFQERFLRIYCRMPNEEGHMQQAFRSAFREIMGDE
eukprot:Ihof_evm14s68 gene=Ihof_evmTU14s68